MHMPHAHAHAHVHVPYETHLRKMCNGYTLLTMATLTTALLYLLWLHSTHYGSRRNLVYLARMYRMPVVATYWDRSTACAILT